MSDSSFDELHAFASRIGIARVAFQGDHYDLDETARVSAIASGAAPVDGRELVTRLVAAGLRRGARYERNGLAGVDGLPSPELVTERLRMRQWRASDLDLADVFTDQPEPGCVGRPSALVRAQIDEDAVLLALRGFGIWALEHRETGRIIGRAGLRPLHEGWRDGPGLVLRCQLIPDWRGRGCAAEAGRAVLADGFTRLGVRAVFAAHRPSDLHSAALLHVLGFTPLRETAAPDPVPGRVLSRISAV